MILKVDDLHFAYRKDPVLEGVSFSVEKNELLVLLGVNGSGKSTLLKCLNRIHEPKKGRVTINEKEMHRLSPMEVARRIGYVPQYFDHGGISVYEMVLLGRRPHITFSAGAGDYEIVDEILMLFELDHLAERTMHELSGGEAQKVMIARAMAQEPELLLLDEPTSNLDIRNQHELMRLVRHVVESHGLTVVVTLHDLDMALQYADRLVMLRDRGIFWSGPPEDISAELVEKVYGVPVSIREVEGRRLVLVDKDFGSEGL